MIYRNILTELGLKGEEIGTLGMNPKEDKAKLGMDNQAAISAFSSPTVPNNSRHIKMDHNFLRDLVAEKEIVLHYVDTESMTADILTKPLARIQFIKLRNKVNMTYSVQD